jgi:hypothetical protein
MLQELTGLTPNWQLLMTSFLQEMGISATSLRKLRSVPKEFIRI